MADAFRIEVKGIKELQNKFKQLDMDLQQALFEAVSSGAAVVVREAKINSERGGDEFPHRITGNLMRSIKEVRIKGSGTRVESQVGSTMKYARRLEKGFMDVDRLGRRYHQPPRPFLIPALDENEAQVIEAFEKKIEEIIRRYR